MLGRGVRGLCRVSAIDALCPRTTRNRLTSRPCLNPVMHSIPVLVHFPFDFELHHSMLRPVLAWHIGGSS
jgi:hypothetical protein